VSKLVHCLATTILLTLLSGCTSFLPPNAYPIYRYPTTAEQTELTKQQTSLGAYTDLTTAKATVMNERLWYLKAAEDAQRGIYNQSDWATAGGALGTIGGLTKSVSTAAVGAIVGGGSAVVASRYSLAGQSKAYLLAADKAGCTWAVLDAYGRDTVTEAPIGDGAVLTEASLGALQIESELRRTLMDFNPAQDAVDPKQILALYQQHKDAADAAKGKVVEVVQQRETLADKEYGVTALRDSLSPPEANAAGARASGAVAAAATGKSNGSAALAAAAAAELRRAPPLSRDESRKRRIAREMLGGTTEDKVERLKVKIAQRDEAAADLARLTAEQAQLDQKVVVADLRACVLTARPVNH